MTTVFLMLDHACNQWYLTYSVTNKALEEFARTCHYNPVLYSHHKERKVYIQVHKDRQALVLQTAMDFAEYFNVTLEIL